MHSIFIEYVYLKLIILALVMIANKLRPAYPIVLVLGGLALSFTTKFSNIIIDRNLILFITFIVILVTLVFQGLTLPWVIRKVKPDDKYTSISEHDQELIIQKKIAKVSLQFLEQKYGDERVQNEHLENLFRRLQTDLKSLDKELEESNETENLSAKKYRSIYLEVIKQQRQLLNEMNRSAEIDEELIRKYLALIDLEEFKTREKQLQKL